MFTDFVCFQFYFRDYVAQPCSQIGTAYICSSIKVLSRNAQRCIFVDCAGVRFIIINKMEGGNNGKRARNGNWTDIETVSLRELCIKHSSNYQKEGRTVGRDNCQG